MSTTQIPDARKVLTPTSYNGLLLYIQSQFVSDASKILPSPSDKESHTPIRKVEIDTNVGKVVITFKLSTYKHYRNSYWRWSGEWADAVEGGQ